MTINARVKNKAIKLRKVIVLSGGHIFKFIFKIYFKIKLNLFDKDLKT